MPEISITGPAKEWLTATEVQSELSITSSQLTSLIRAGLFPRGVRAGHKAPPRWRNLDVAAILWLLNRGCILLPTAGGKKSEENEDEEIL